jgi:hypothetical protein
MPEKSPRLISFEHDEDAEGWCSLCHRPAPRGVLFKAAEVTGGSPQFSPTFDKAEDSRARPVGNFHYRLGACCIGRMVLALEKKDKA